MISKSDNIQARFSRFLSNRCIFPHQHNKTHTHTAQTIIHSFNHFYVRDFLVFSYAAGAKWLRYVSEIKHIFFVTLCIHTHRFAANMMMMTIDDSKSG